MLLPDNFTFSQNNLQDYIDCRRRFLLRHIQKLEWPAIESEPVLEQEQLMLLGQQFHLMVQQKLSGIPEEILSQSTQSPELLAWWFEFVKLAPDALPGQKYCEAFYSIPIGAYRLVAKYDLLVIQEDGKATLYDWKTSHHAPKRSTMQQRMQTRVYPYLLAKLAASGSQFVHLDVEQLKMVYWYPDPTIQPIEFQYSSQQFEKDETFLNQLVAEIASLPEEAFAKTLDTEHKCKFCRYRTLCETGVIPGTFTDADPETEDTENLFDLDFDDLAVAD
jgi:hypothetical protein